MGSETTKPKATLLLVHGPNLNLLGTREPGLYGSLTLPELENKVSSRAESRSLNIGAFQSNHEGAIIDFIHSHSPFTKPAESTDLPVKGVIINAGALTHTSVAIRDALLSVAIPFVEVHITNVHKREPFRHLSYLSDKAEAVICGLGLQGYLAAVDWFAEKIEKDQDQQAK
ncbi:hypothetical protein H2198_006344 [Neophaeococcomyces mojaviensis]|uniref:Uncharacterized protein n=1 Tax=Neophaeococcomyces mojaviensis TaxID=3383035 RepID=A0ACC3A360_9EURO|nr:hypothetical protein H2198_006344 [Knufia sp. JES_112]